MGFSYFRVCLSCLCWLTLKKMTGVSKNKTTEESYIRQLPYSVVKYLSCLLDVDKQWERLVVKIPKRLQDVGNGATEMRYSNLQVRLFEDKGKRADGSPTKSILDDWATQNTKVKHLIRILQEAALYEAADYLAVNVLHQSKVPRLQPEPFPNTAGLPAPEWQDKKPKDKDDLPFVKEKLMSENFDKGYGKECLYEREKFVGHSYVNGDPAHRDLPYNRLMTPGVDEAGYNKLSPGADGLNYHRTSFDSGGLSGVLKAENQYLQLSTGEEHEEETKQVRSFSEDTVVQKDGSPYSYAYSSGKGVYEFAKDIQERGDHFDVQGTRNNVPQSNRREPCETSEKTETEEQEEEDLYKLLGNRKITYELLKMVTDDFNPKVLKAGGRVLGTGGFGDVFLGQMNNGFKIAVKRLKNVDDVDKQFATELNSLVKYRHKNIVRLYGFSVDGPGKCLVYEYLSNGSLEDRLMRKDNTPPLTVEVRLNILKGTAQGIHFLNAQGIVHRDIKSANVLLDDNFEPKVGDFATVRAGPRGNVTMAQSTSVVIGTKAYLAPEALYFDVSTKLDSYSFGIIILEVLTALPPLDDSREEIDIKSHVEENHITHILDTSGGKWLDETVAKLVQISDKCTQTKKKYRANVEDILSDLMVLT